MDSFEMLNKIYKPLCDKSTDISRGLKDAGYQAKVQFHNSHSVKRNDEFKTEHFPIPVIFIRDNVTIGVDIDDIWLEAVLPKEQAINIDFAEFTSSYKIEIYGSENFLCDLYNDQMDVSNIIGNISNSLETSICVAFYLSSDVLCDQLVNIVQLFAV